jgi:hypothetical protein
MAQTTIITDDLHGSANAKTIEFSFDGASYTIDLSKKNRTALEKALRPYIGVATPVSTPRRKSGGSTARRARQGRGRRRNSGPDLAAVRAWASGEGIEVSNRGRVAQDVIDAYTSVQ